jgi:hypothetical protein
LLAMGMAKKKEAFQKRTAGESPDQQQLAAAQRAASARPARGSRPEPGTQQTAARSASTSTRSRGLRLSDNPRNRGGGGRRKCVEIYLGPLVGRLPVRFGASKRALNYRDRVPLIKRALPRGAFFDPIPRLEAPEVLYSPAKPAIFFYWRPSGARPGRPATSGLCRRSQARLDSERNRKRCACGGVDTPRCTWCGVCFRAPGDLQVHPRN